MIKRSILLCLLAAMFSNAFTQVNVTFRVIGLPKTTPDPKTIFLAGSFNGWNPANADWKVLNDDSMPIYSRTIRLTLGDYEYKVTRGSWNTVECNALGADMPNRDLHVLHDTTILIKITEWKDNYPLAVKAHTASKNVHLLDAAFNMPQLGRTRRIWIYLPEGYETANKKYSVIYMHDGQNLFDENTAGTGEWGVDEFLDQLKTADKQFIIVGIDHGGEFRLTEYNPYDSKYGKATGDAYARFLVETLKPYIDKHYRTLKDTKNTTVAGSSMGGLISMYAALKYPKVFGNAGIFSPSFWIAPQIYEYAKTEATKTSRFYFVCGEMESAKETDDVTKMVAFLKVRGLPEKNIPSIIIKGAKHNETQWQGDFPGFYRWLFTGK